MKRARGERRLADDCQSRRRRRRSRSLPRLDLVDDCAGGRLVVEGGPRFPAWLRRQNKNRGRNKSEKGTPGRRVSLSLSPLSVSPFLGARETTSYFQSYKR